MEGNGGARLSKDRTFRLAFPLPIRLKAQSAKPEIPRKTYRNPILFAREWQALSVKMGWSQVDIARHFGVSEARVSQVFRLIKLAPEAQEIIVAMGDNLTYMPVSERDLRAQVNLPREDQVAFLRVNIIAS